MIQDYLHYDPFEAINALWFAFFASMALSFIMGAVVRIYFDVVLRYYKKINKK